MKTDNNDKVLRALALQLIKHAPGSAASEVEDLPDKELAAYIADLNRIDGALILKSMSPVSSQRLLEHINPDLAGQLLSVLDVPVAASLAARLTEEMRHKQLSFMDPEKAREINDLVKYPVDTAGSIMDPQVMAFNASMKTSDVLKQLRKLPAKGTREIYLVDENGVFEGSVLLQTLAVADSKQTLGELKGSAPVEVMGVTSSSEVMDSLSNADVFSVVVVDIDRHLLGVIRRDKLIKAALETASADAQLMVGAGKDERALSPAFFVVRKRLPWLIINLATAFLAAAVVGIFESTIAKFTALAVLLPVVAGQSGNTGAQALAVTMRGLALREIRISQAFLVCLKELKAGFLNGLIVSVVTAGAVYLWSGSSGLALIIVISMVISMSAAALSGALIPVLLTVLKQDPAQSSSIVLTTVTDVVGFLSFLGTASVLSYMI